MGNQCKHLTMTQHNELPELLQKLKECFDGKLGTWRTDPVDFGLKENSKPIYSQTNPGPKVKN